MSSHGFHPFGGRVSRHFGDSLHPDNAYLSYYDVRLTREDVDTIKNDWLTDNAISFYEEWLERERLSQYPRAHINLLRPSMCFMIIQTPDPSSLKGALPDFRQSTHIFLPINDCTSPDIAEGGSHWSLLLVSILDGVAFHYDSLYPANHTNAETAAYKLGRIVGRPLRFVNLPDAPQQDNGKDCGVFVCLVMKYLLMKKLLQKDSSEQVNMSMRGLEVDASKGREDIVKMIEGYRREGLRSQSRSQSPFNRKSLENRSPPRIGD